MRTLTFISDDVTCAAWHLPATTDALTGPEGRPCVVLAHGFAGTKDSGLLAFAEPFAQAGIDAFVFDYRGFGESEGRPRQDVNVRRQRQDYHAALAAARSLPGVDPRRVALWGTSYAGGHAVAVGAQDGNVAAVVGMTPAMDGLVSLAHLGRHAGVGSLVRATGHGLRDVAHALAKRSPHLLAVAGQPGTSALMTTPGAGEICREMAGPTWRNEVCARHALQVGLNRPVTYAGKLQAPLLVQVGTNDSVAPPAAARRTARKAGRWAVLKEYPVDHFDVYDGVWQERLCADQVDFLVRMLDPGRPSATSPDAL
jgi:fermentation-respiration switch protein FrsA (DUF1100 family)